MDFRADFLKDSPHILRILLNAQVAMQNFVFSPASQTRPIGLMFWPHPSSFLQATDVLLAQLLLIALLLCASPQFAFAGSDKIDPAGYICAEYVATVSIEHAPPLFEGLQIDGYAAAKEGQTVADSQIMPTIMLEIYALCQSQPETKVLPLWQRIRSRLPVASKGKWQANSTRCEQYNKNPDDGSGFVIWLDGYLRGKENTDASVLKSDLDLDAFFEECKRAPQSLMIDALRKTAH